MPSCSGTGCGVGGASSPTSGEPSSNVVLSAATAFGGIDLSWSYPSTNPQSVAYAKIYRASSSDFDTALLVAQVGGAFFYDKLGSPNQYWYWVRLVSRSGAVSDPLGPASAMSSPLLSELLQKLVGRIGHDSLTTNLREQVAEIQTLRAALAAEVIARQQGETALSGAVAAMGGVNSVSMAAITAEQAARVSADSALADSITDAVDTLMSEIDSATSGTASLPYYAHIALRNAGIY